MGSGQELLSFQPWSGPLSALLEQVSQAGGWTGMDSRPVSKKCGHPSAWVRLLILKVTPHVLTLSMLNFPVPS